MANEEQMKTIVNDLYKFYRLFIVSKTPNPLPAQHVKEISRLLMKQYTGEIPYLCVSTPPRHSKSALISQAYPLWLLAHNHEANILVVTASHTLSENFGIQLRQLLAEYGELFGIKLSRVKQSSTYIRLEDLEGNLLRGSVRLTSIGSQITGLDADYVIIDDYIKNLEDLTPSALDKQWDWFNTVLLQRLEPHTKLTILGTRWSSEEIQGRLKRDFSDRYKFAEFPAIKDDGTPLWPEKYSIEDLNKIKDQMGERMFSALYQQKPLDMTSSFFAMDKVHFGLPSNYNPERTIRCWDLAATDDGGDYTVGVKAARSGKDLVILEMVRGQFGSRNQEVIKETTIKDGHHIHQFVEFGTTMAAKQLLPFYKDLLSGYTVDALIPLKSKEDRATTLQGKTYDGEVYIALDNGVEDLITEMSAFPLETTHDDIVDAISYCCNKLFIPEGKKARLGTIKIN